MALPPVVAVEIGTSKIIALVGEVREGGHIMITGMGKRPATGVRKGEVIDLENLVTGARSVLAEAEESGKVAIREVHLSMSGGHIRSVTNRGALPVLDEDGEITREDIEQVMEVARAVNLPPDREILHTISQRFCIDDEHHVLKPEGMEGARIALDMLIVHGSRSRLRNTVKALESIPVAVEDVAFSGLCSALAVLSPEQKKSGVVVVDMGGGTTDYLAYADNVVAAAGVLAVGGDHVTNDIALAFTIPVSQAERLKCEAGSVLPSQGNGGQRIGLPAEMGFQGRSVDVRSLNTVVHARVDETLRMVQRCLDDDGVLRRVGAGVILTGGAAHVKGIVELAEQVFGLPCVVGRPRNVSGLATATEGPEYATCVGMVQYGFKSATDQRAGPALGGWLRGLFGR